MHETMRLVLDSEHAERAGLVARVAQLRWEDAADKLLQFHPAPTHVGKQPAVNLGMVDEHATGQGGHYSLGLRCGKGHGRARAVADDTN